MREKAIAALEKIRAEADDRWVWEDPLDSEWLEAPEDLSSASDEVLIQLMLNYGPSGGFEG